MARQPDIQYIRFYTDGSAARQIAPVNAVKKAALPRQKKQKRRLIYVDPVATLGIVVAVCMLVLMAVGIGQYAQAQKEAAAMEQYVAQLSQRNEELTSQYEAGYDLETVEKTALALGMVPAEQVRHVQIQVTLPEAEEQTVSLWERIGTFLTGLFA